MARTSYGATTHTVTATGSNDNSKQVSVNAWNATHNKSEAGMLGFTKQSATISTNAIAATGTLIEIQADGTLNTITPTDTNEFDLIYLIAKSTATSVTITHDAGGGAGKIRLLSAANETLSTTSPLILMCRTIGSNKEWVQYGGGVVNSLNDIGDVNITSIADNDLLAYDNSTSKWINQSPSEAGIITADSTTTFTNKTYDADATGNNLTNVENANIKAAAGIDATKIADGTVTSAEFQYINTLSSNAQTQLDGKQASLTFGISSGNVTKAGSGIVDNDFIRVDGTTFEGRSASEVLSDIGGQASLTFGIANTNAVKVDDADAADDDYAKFTATGLEGRSATEVKTDLSLNNVENTAVSTWTGSTNITTLGTIATGTWEATDVGITHGGTGQSTQQAAIDALTNVSAATQGHVLQKDGSGNAVFAAAASGSDTPWTEVHNFAGYYYDMTVQTKPANPSANNARFYVKEIDSNNDGLFCIIRKNGSDTQEVQIA